MTKRLSQHDVDALIKGGRPVVHSEEMVPYNFQRPPRLAKDQRTALEATLKRFAYSFQAFLTTRLRAPTDLTVRGIEEVTHSEFLLSLEDPCVTYVFHVGPEHGVLNMGGALAHFLVNRLFGGTGGGEPPARTLTALEQTAVRGLVDRSLVLLSEAWGGSGPIGKVVAYESSPEALRAALSDEPALVANLDLVCGDFKSFVAICIPLGVLEAPTSRVASRPAVPSAWRDRLESAVPQLRVQLSVQLPPVRLGARTIARFQVGQVIDPRVPLDAPVDVRVNGQVRFRGALGKLHRRVGLQITDIVAAPPEQAAPARHRRVLL
jgi:flagellar motor switch protein FliM